MPNVAPLITLRLRAQLLSRPRVTGVVEVVKRLLAVQAQDRRAAWLALRARSANLTPGAIDRELTLSRELVSTWLNRGTLHLVASADYWWLQPLTTPQLLVANARMLSGFGVSSAQAKRGLTAITTALARNGPMLAQNLREVLRSAGVPVAGQAGYLVLARAGLSGATVRGPMLETEQAYVLVRDWLGRPPPPLPREQALAQLAERYLLGHGPADERDLAHWVGIGVGEARIGLRALGSRAIEWPGGRLDLADRPPVPSRIGPRLLGGFDPLMFGWVDRGPLLREYEAALVTRNGIFRPALLARKRIVGTWRRTDAAPVLEPFEELTPSELAALARDARDVQRFLADSPA